MEKFQKMIKNGWVFPREEHADLPPPLQNSQLGFLVPKDAQRDFSTKNSFAPILMQFFSTYTFQKILRKVFPKEKQI